jgi:hypothetical protein
MLTDKHIDQYAGYLMEDLPNYNELILDKGLSEVLISMYKKGFEDCLMDTKGEMQ